MLFFYTYIGDICVKYYRKCNMGYCYNYVDRWRILFFVTSLYILCTLGIGLGFSARYRKQFPAILSATSLGSLPPVFLSGAIFPIISMPPIWQWVLQFYPVTHFVVFLKSEFLEERIGRPSCNIHNSIDVLCIDGIVRYPALTIRCIPVP